MKVVELTEETDELNRKIIDSHPDFNFEELAEGDVVETYHGDFYKITGISADELYGYEVERDEVYRWLDGTGTPTFGPTEYDDLMAKVAEKCVSYYSEFEDELRCIIEYDGWGRVYAGQDFYPGDFDVNMFFESGCDVSSTVGMPKVIGEVDGRKIEVMRNKVPEGTSIQSYANSMTSGRWTYIRNNPKVKIYPEIRYISWD